jgi:hypothetical protein
MAKRHIKRAKDDLLEETIFMNKLEHFLKRALIFILTMARILSADLCLLYVIFFSNLCNQESS